MRTIRKNQEEIQQIKTSVLTEVKNAFHGLIIILDKAEERVSKHEDKSMETQTKKMDERKKKDIQNSRDHFKQFNLFITVIPEGQERDKGESFLEKKLLII